MWCTPEIRAREKVVDEGITEERCIEIVQTTPIACRIAASIQSSTDPDGNINPDRLEMELGNALFAKYMAKELREK